MSSMKNSPILGNLCYTSSTMRGRGREHRPMSNAPEERSPSAPPQGVSLWRVNRPPQYAVGPIVREL